MKPDPWIQERNAKIVRQFELLRQVGSPFDEAINILASEYHLGFSSIKNMINMARKRKS